MADEIKDAILENAQGPKKVQGDAGSFENHPIPDQIAADKYLAAKDAVATPKRGLRITRLVPPGTHC
jgi:hypothetical protein